MTRLQTPYIYGHHGNYGNHGILFNYSNPVGDKVTETVWGVCKHSQYFWTKSHDDYQGVQWERGKSTRTGEMVRAHV